MIYDLRFTIRRAAFAFLLFNFSLAALAANLQVPVKDLARGNVKHRRVTLTSTDAPRQDGTALITVEPVAQFTGTNGVTTFTNVVWGNYRLDIAGAPGTAFRFFVPDTNTTLSVLTLIQNPTPPGAITNYYTMAQVDALLECSLATNQVITVGPSINTNSIIIDGDFTHPYFPNPTTLTFNNTNLTEYYGSDYATVYADNALNYIIATGPFFSNPLDARWFIKALNDDVLLYVSSVGPVGPYTLYSAFQPGSEVVPSSITHPAASSWVNYPGIGVISNQLAITILRPGPVTNTLYFTNGLLWRVSAP